MKKIISILILILAALLVFTACNKKNSHSHTLNGLSVDSAEFKEKYIDSARGGVLYTTPGIKAYDNEVFKDYCGEIVPGYYICETCSAEVGIGVSIPHDAFVEGETQILYQEILELDTPIWERYYLCSCGGKRIVESGELSEGHHHMLNGLSIDSQEFKNKYVHSSNTAVYVTTPGLNMFTDVNLDDKCGEIFDAWFECETCFSIVCINAYKPHDAFIYGQTELKYRERYTSEGAIWERYYLCSCGGAEVVESGRVMGTHQHTLQGLPYESDEFAAKYREPQSGAIYYSTSGVMVFADINVPDHKGEVVGGFFKCEICGNVISIQVYIEQ